MQSLFTPIAFVPLIVGLPPLMIRDALPTAFGTLNLRSFAGCETCPMLSGLVNYQLL